jgi:hypothetical protein
MAAAPACVTIGIRDLFGVVIAFLYAAGMEMLVTAAGAGGDAFRGAAAFRVVAPALGGVERGAGQTRQVGSDARKLEEEEREKLDRDGRGGGQA